MGTVNGSITEWLQGNFATSLRGLKEGAVPVTVIDTASCPVAIAHKRHEWNRAKGPYRRQFPDMAICEGITEVSLKAKREHGRRGALSLAVALSDRLSKDVPVSLVSKHRELFERVWELLATEGGEGDEVAPVMGA